jgi:uncharacterized protein (TIGR00266 family)
MRYELLYQPSFAVARVTLDLGEGVRAESGAMVSMSQTVQISVGSGGGLGKMLGRLLGGESLFQSTFTATTGPGEVVLAPTTPGDIQAIELAGSSMMVTSGCYLAGDTSLEMETAASARGFFSGEGLFLLRVRGAGTLLVSSFGAIHRVDLQPGQPYIVDTGHLVAFTDGMGFQLRKATRSLVGMVTSGEGIVAEMTGPGTVFIQTRTPQGFASWLGSMIPRG